MIKISISICKLLDHFFNESYNNMNELVGHLYNWALSSDYVEVHILTFSDGTYTVVETSGNTANSASLYG